MARLIALAAVLCCLLTTLPAALPAAAAPQVSTLCRVTDPRITELSGLAADAEHWYASNDGGSRVVIYVLDHDCTVRRTIDSDTNPYDTEDLALAADGTLWLADTGDNNHRRATVALLSVAPDGRAAIHRLTYPDGPHDTEALLLGRDGVPLLITKVPLGFAQVFRPTGPLAVPGPTTLRQVATLAYPATGTPGGPVLNSVSNVLVTGAAVSQDGTVAAVRTYTDVYLYPAPDGDLVAALGRAPVRVPLPNEKQGEAVAFQPDGTLLSGSEGEDAPIRAVRGAAALVAPSAPATTSAGSTASAAPGTTAAPAAPDRSGLPLLVAIGVAALVLAVLVIVFGARGRRRRG